MGKYITKRLIYMVISIWLIATVTFFLMHAIPGDPFTDSKKLPPEIMENLKRKYNLDKPLIVQYFLYLKNLAKGDLGISLRYKNRTVNGILFSAFPNSAKLGLAAVGVGVTLGLTLGIIAALNNKGFFDYFAILVAVIGVSVPSFVLAGMFQYWFGVQLEILPVAGWGKLKFMILPVFALGFRLIAFQARLMRTNMIEIMGQDYIKTAKAKGLSKPAIVVKHVIRNAILPVITVLGPLTAAIMTGSFVIESIFGIPGMGKYFVDAINQRDYTLILGTTLFYATLLIMMVFVVDILYGIVDPRIRIDE
ncbi:ABC transporter permease [Thermohalobacter berrensis]|uniref:Peptide ABC transporter permease n=1 Tax=Thermohalobacter berrensis TaxID=99594 RepID=A0A419SUU9_9FIRM|nr:ABC transporter permease [Thermohalobacter berrensis]RKD28995.1 peptide ABC transporter permease [Thermohalobacter berrensis]